MKVVINSFCGKIIMKIKKKHFVSHLVTGVNKVNMALYTIILVYFINLFTAI